MILLWLQFVEPQFVCVINVVDLTSFCGTKLDYWTDKTGH